MTYCAATIAAPMPDLRKAVENRLKELGWTPYRLVQALKGKRKGKKDVPAATVYQFLAGRTTINSEYLGLIFDAVGLAPIPTKKN